MQSNRDISQAIIPQGKTNTKRQEYINRDGLVFPEIDVTNRRQRPVCKGARRLMDHYRPRTF
jgi:hypothetical protein